MAVRTPATKEGATARVLKKRKCLYDEMIVIPYKYVNVNINSLLFNGDYLDFMFIGVGGIIFSLLTCQKEYFLFEHGVIMSY